MPKNPAAFLWPVVLCCLFVVVSCAREESPVKPDSSDPEKILVSGSASVTPILKTLASEFSKSEPEIEIVFPPDSHSSAGIAGTAEGQYDIGSISREMNDEEKEAGLRYLHLAADGLVLVTSGNLEIPNVTSDQVRGIYEGRITNWKQLGGPNAKIGIIDRPEHTSAKIAFRRTLLGLDLQITPEAIVVERPWQVTDSIQLIPNSIGYTSLGEIISENPPVNVLALDGVVPSPVNLGNGRYRFFRPFGLVLGPTPKVSTMKFVNFIFSDTGSKIIENSGYKPHRYEILIGIVPEQNPMVQNQRYEPLAKYLSQKLENKLTVKLKLYPTYIEACRDLARGEINAAFLGSLAYTTVRRYVDVLARPDYSGVSTYRGLIFVRADSGIESVAQMRGKRLVMGGMTTTAGYVFPLFFFQENGIPEYWNYFSAYRFVGTHEDAILSVLGGEADVGAAKDLILNMLVSENPQLDSNLRIIAESPAVPSNAFVLRKDIDLPCFDCHQSIAHRGRPDDDDELNLDLGEAIKNYLLMMDGDLEGVEALRAIGNAARFLETNDSDYLELYTMLEEIQLEPENLLDRNARMRAGAK